MLWYYSISIIDAFKYFRCFGRNHNREIWSKIWNVRRHFFVGPRLSSSLCCLQQMDAVLWSSHLWIWNWDHDDSCPSICFRSCLVKCQRNAGIFLSGWLTLNLGAVNLTIVSSIHRLSRPVEQIPDFENYVIRPVFHR